MKKVFITGITGQDGAYLAQLMLEKGYKVYGAYRRSSSQNFWRLEELGIYNNPNLELVEYDLTDISLNIRLIKKIRPDEVYNLAAQSFVGVSFKEPITTAQITALGTLNILEAIRIVDKNIKFYQASTSEMFGKVAQTPQKETTPFYPRSPYGVSKLFAHWMTINYKESYNIFACSGILFNHESPLRGKEFVTRKITDSVAKIKLNKLDCLELGNLDAKRDWGYAKEYVKGMYLMMQNTTPDTYILATNTTHSVRDFVKLAFEEIGIRLKFTGKGIDEKGIDTNTNKVLVKVNPEFFRPAEVDVLIGDYTKAKNKLNWQPTTSLKEIVSLMVKADIKRNQKGYSF